MKKLKSRLVAVMALAAVVATLGVMNASSQSQALNAKVPFDFYVNGTLMPAGTYHLRPISPGNWVYGINDDAGNAVMVGTIRVDNRKPASSQLVFNRYGSLYFLSELDWEGSANGHAILKSNAEKEAMASAAAVRVALTAK